MQWQAVIGLEVHTQLATASKIFSSASTAYGAPPNAQACPVDLGFPGVLPVINEKAIEMAVRFGLAVNAQIASRSIFARKNYFYPDLPKGYQISQYEDPIVAHGELQIDIDGESKTIEIVRAHLEEDAGKSTHGEIPGATAIDLNRAGTPLLEIVTAPVMHSAREAVAYMRELHRLVRHLGICDGNMQEGSFRCDANVSVRPMGTTALGTRTEIKNLNSFRFVERAIEFEIERQIGIIEDGGNVIQETRLYDSDDDETRSMRSKEDAHDYRYFPDPDLLPVEVSEISVKEIRSNMPELPRARCARYMASMQLSYEDAIALTNDPQVTRYFEDALTANSKEPKLLANWVIGELFGALNKANLGIEDSPVPPQALCQLLTRVSDETISGKQAKQVFQAMWESRESPDQIIESRGFVQVSDTDIIEAAVKEVLKENPAQAAEYSSGKEKLLGFLVGQVMKKTHGKANPKIVSDLIKAIISS